MLFAFFSNFNFRCQYCGKRAKNAKKWPEIRNNYVCASTPYLSKHTSYDRVFLLHKFKMMTSPDDFFHFLKILFFWVVRGRGLKRQKMTQNNKKICLTSYLRKFTSYDWFSAHICKMISPGNFFIFSSLTFWVFQSSSINKCQKKILRCAPPSSHMIFLLNYDLFCLKISLIF